MPGLSMTNQENEVPGSFLKVAILLAVSTGFAKVLPGQHDLQGKLDRAQALARRGEVTAAEQEYLAAIQLDPKSYEAHNDLGALYMSAKRFKSACREFALAANLNQGVAAIHQNLGICFIETGNFAGAAAALKKAEELDPQDVRTRYFLGYCLFTLNKMDEAKVELEYVLNHKPDDENTLFYLIRIYTQRKDYDKAAEAFAELAKAHPDSVFVHILSGESYDLKDDTKDAIEEFKKAVALAPQMPRLHF